MSDLERFLETFRPQQEEADLALHNGDPEPRMQLWSREDPVTLSGALGVAASGWQQVSETFRWVASQFSRGEGLRLRPSRLRVTHVYRRENGEWKIVHRHGDGLEANRAPSPAEQHYVGTSGSDSRTRRRAAADLRR